MSDVKDFIDLNDKLNKLGCQIGNGFTLLPENIADANTVADFVYTDNTITVNKLFRINNLPIKILHSDELKTKQRRSIDWYAPTLFISYTLLSQNPELISVGLNVISNYVTDIFKGKFGKKDAKISIVVETDYQKSYKEINYEGPIDGIKDLDKLITKLK